MTTWPRVWVNVELRLLRREVAQRTVAKGSVGEVIDVVGDARASSRFVRQRYRFNSSIYMEPQNDSMGALS